MLRRDREDDDSSSKEEERRQVNAKECFVCVCVCVCVDKTKIEINGEATSLFYLSSVESVFVSVFVCECVSMCAYTHIMINNQPQLTQQTGK